MKRIGYLFLATSEARLETVALGCFVRAKAAWSPPPCRAKICRSLWCLATVLLPVLLMIAAAAETRPHYGGTLRIMLQAAPNTLEFSPTGTSAEYWDTARMLSLIGDTLVTLDAQDHPQPALALTWQSEPGGRRWQFTIRRAVKFHDGSPASPAAISQILGALHPNWSVRASADSVSIESETPMPSILAELALPRNMLLKRNANGIPTGTGAFLIVEWQPGRLLKLAANEDSWAGRPFVDSVEIELGKPLREQAIALELDRVDIIESSPQANAAHRQGVPSSFSSLPVELLALVFPSRSKAQDPRLREALAFAIDRKPMQAALLKGVGEPAGAILPNWMTGYDAVFSARANLQRARTVLADSRQPALNLNYDPRDPQAQLMAERIALNAREVGITVQVSLSGPEDIRLTRVVLPSPDPAISLSEASRQLELPQPLVPLRADSLDDLYQTEHTLIDGYSVIPLFHIPLATATGANIRNWEPGRLGLWNEPGSSIADVWLADLPNEIGPR
jgi:ABC-type transport system substrate-binding protein